MGARGRPGHCSHNEFCHPANQPEPRDWMRAGIYPHKARLMILTKSNGPIVLLSPESGWADSRQKTQYPTKAFHQNEVATTKTELIYFIQALLSASNEKFKLLIYDREFLSARGVKMSTRGNALVYYCNIISVEVSRAVLDWGAIWTVIFCQDQTLNSQSY